MFTIGKNEAREMMNEFGASRTPFIFIIDYSLSRNHIIRLSDIDPSEILFDFNGTGNAGTADRQVSSAPVRLITNPMSFNEYSAGFDVVISNLIGGNSFLTNLTCRTPIECNHSLSDIFHKSKARYRLLFNDEFVCTSPEIFVKIDNGSISSYPMKGTIDASVADARNVIINDSKEKAEHATIVDLIRNDISMHAKDVRVERYRYIDRLETSNGALLQVSSEVRGNLADNYTKHIGDIIYDMLPAGSICGAPKKKTLEIIASAEGIDRGYYTGVAGIFDGENLDSCVMIRFIEKDNEGNLFFRSGGGITAKSDARAEYEEMIQKIYIASPLPEFVETIRIEDGQMQNTEFHQKRMEHTIKGNFGPDAVIPSLHDLTLPDDIRPDTTYKCRVVYSRAITGVEILPYSSPVISSLVMIGDDSIDYHYKSTDRSHLNTLHEKASMTKPGSDALIVKNGLITDTTFCNVALFDGCEWTTPRLPLLKGTMRAQLIKDGDIKEADIKADEISKYKSIALFNAMNDFGSIIIDIKDII